MMGINNRHENAPSRSPENGFTMIELLIAMAMSTIVLTAVMALYLGLTKSYATETARAGAQQDLRAALSLMCEDIRPAGLDPLGTAGGGITVTSATDITLIADLDYDGAVTAGNNEQIRYYLNGNELWQEVDGGSGAILLDNVTALSFTGLSDDGGATISTVVISMTVQAPAGRQGNVTRALTERVRLRNM